MKDEHMTPDFSSGSYWEDRYAAGNNSGSGSYGQLAEFKAKFLNSFARKHPVRSIIEFGSGDGNQLSLANYKRYTGIDVSSTAVELCKTKFAHDKTKSFLVLSEYSGQKADLVLSLDVIFHLVEDENFDAHMQAVFNAAEKYVIIYSSNYDSQTRRPHVRHRNFLTWVLNNRPDFSLIKYKPNPYSRSGAEQFSPSEFFVFRNLYARSNSPREVISSLKRGAVSGYRTGLADLLRRTKGLVSTLSPTVAGSASSPWRTISLGNAWKSAPAIDIVTVVFEDELPFLALQARSIRRFLPHANIGSIVIMINEPDPAVCHNFIRKRALFELGSLADKVVVGDLGMFEGASRDIEGWLSQQACKLAASRLCRSEYFLVLDAKHHFIRPVEESDLFEEGRAKKPLASVRADQKSWLVDSLRYFGVDTALADHPAPASAPPFLMHSATVRDMVSEIETREKADLLSFFANKTDFTTEFTLYFAYLLKTGQAERFLVDGRSGHRDLRIVTRGRRREELDTTLFDGSVWCFSIHRRRFAKLPDTDRQLIIRKWHQAGLFPSKEQAGAAVSELTHHFRNLRAVEAERIRRRDARRERLAALAHAPVQNPTPVTESPSGNNPMPTAESHFDKVTKEFSQVKYMDERRAIIIRDIIRKFDAKEILEVGFFRGKSSIYIGAILEDAGEGHLTTIDRITARRLTPNIEDLAQKTGLTHRIRPIFAHRSFTWELSKLIRTEPRPQFDLCYFDGGHTWDDTGFGFTLVDYLLKPGGIIVFDDLDWNINSSGAFRRNPEMTKLYSEDERQARTVRLVWDILVPERGYAQLEEISSVGWAVAQKPIA